MKFQSATITSAPLNIPRVHDLHFYLQPSAAILDDTMALKITRSTLLDTLKDVVPFRRNPNRAERNNKIDTSADTITCPNRSSNLHPVSRKLIRGLSRFARAKKAIKMWTPREKKVVGKVEADLAYAASKPLPESPARGSVCSSNTYSPKVSQRFKS